MNLACKLYLPNIQKDKISDRENSCSWRFIKDLAVVSAFCTSLTLSDYAQIPPASQLPQGGFQVVTEINRADMVHIEAKKPNSDFPKAHIGHGIVLAINWSPNPGACESVGGIRSTDSGGPRIKMAPADVGASLKGLYSG